MMRTRAKMQVVASDRARRENVPRYILFYGIRVSNSLQLGYDVKLYKKILQVSLCKHSDKPLKA